MVSISELMSAVRQIQKVPDAQKMESIAQVLSKIDDDRDGTVRVDDVLKVFFLEQLQFFLNTLFFLRSLS
jgi:LETM1 and EF-hand domain-containing protein 1, mitochondrial